MRQYDQSSLFSRIIGSTGLIDAAEKDDYISAGYNLNETVGKSGLEFTYEKHLRGIDGKRIITKLSNSTSTSLPSVSNGTSSSARSVVISFCMVHLHVVKSYAEWTRVQALRL